MKNKSNSKVEIINGSDGPTGVFIAGHSKKQLLKVSFQTLCKCFIHSHRVFLIHSSFCTGQFLAILLYGQGRYLFMCH